MKTLPQIDILMATYNGERFIREQITSIQMQTYDNWQLLISDDCSHDGTVDIVRDIAAADNRIKIVSKNASNGGAVSNFMYLLSCSNAPYVMFCDQDDVWLPEKVEISFGKMRELERQYGKDTPLLVFSDMVVVDEELSIVHTSFERYSALDPSKTSLKYLLEQNVAAGCTMLLNLQLAKLCYIGGRSSRNSDSSADEDNSAISRADTIRMHDWWAMLVAASLGQIGYVDAPTLLYRQHSNNTVGAYEFDIFGSLGYSKARVDAIRGRIAQAEVLRDIFGYQLTKADTRCIGEYLAIGSSTSYVRGVLHLVLCGCRRYKLRRKVGQVFGVLQLIQENKRHMTSHIEVTGYEGTNKT